jgi:hypothetical protein
MTTGYKGVGFADAKLVRGDHTGTTPELHLAAPTTHTNLMVEPKTHGALATESSSPKDTWALLELTLLLADREDTKYERAALRWHARFAYETTNVDIRESVAVLALLTAIPANRLAAAALRRRSLERCAEALGRWAREA